MSDRDRGLISRKDLVDALMLEKLFPEGFYGSRDGALLKEGAELMLIRVGLALAKLPLTPPVRPPVLSRAIEKARGDIEEAFSEYGESQLKREVLSILGSLSQEDCE